jgi:AcrR family transcriptional regulator
MSNKPAYQRKVPEQRRSELLEVGCRLFASRPYDEVWIDHVAEQAGVSRGLLYHHFGSKRAFLHAIVEHETAALFEATQPDLSLAPMDRLSQTLEAYLDYVVHHAHGYRAMFRGAPGADTTVRQMIDDNLGRQRQRILDAIAPTEPPNQTTSLAIHGWLAFVVATALDWLDHQQIDRAALRELWERTLLATLSAALPPALD